MRSSTPQFRFIWFILITVAVLTIASVSYRYGLHAQESGQYHRSHAYTQAILAFAHYRTISSIEALLQKKCYNAALTTVREEKNLQIHLLSENLHSADKDPQLLEYVKTREPELLASILEGQLPELKQSYTITCP